MIRGDLAIAMAREDLVLLRPAGGIEPRELERVIGRRAAADLEEWQTLQWPHLEP